MSKNDAVVSTRIRLARNFFDLPFPGHMNASQAETLFVKVKDALGKDFLEKRAAMLTPIERLALMEKHLVSPGWVQQGQGSLLLQKDESIAIMLCEEDHVRIQALIDGFSLEEADDITRAVDELIAQKLPYAFDAERGHLTSCPTNTGTGMRASAMLHLPMLTMTSQVEPLFATVTRIGYAVRGLYGEGTGSLGDMYQLSNQITLGLSEEEILQHMKVAVLRITEAEREARELAFHEKHAQIEDMVFRAYGTLQWARTMSAEELMSLASKVRLGAQMGLISIKIEKLARLTTMAQPALLQQREGREMTSEERDEKRAAFIRESIKEIQAQ